MVKTVSATDARIHFGELMDEVETKGQRVIVEKGGRPKVAIVSVEDLHQLPPNGHEQADWWTLVEEAREQFRRAYGDKPLSITPEELIRQMREEE
jgi:prevent-host-death family protein